MCLRVGDGVEQHQLLDAPVQPVVVLEREQERDAAAEGMADDREVAQILILDQLREQLGLVEHRIARVERLVGLAEALEVDGDHAVGEGKCRRDMPPGVGARAEAVDEEHRRALAFLLVEQLDRGVGRPEPRIRADDVAGRGERTGAERQRDRPQGRWLPSVVPVPCAALALVPTRAGAACPVFRHEGRTCERISDDRVASPSVCRCTALRREPAIALVNAT